MKRSGACGAMALGLLLLAAPAKAGDSRLEAFAGYYFAEETEEDISYGARYGWDSSRGWGLMASYEAFETEGSGYGEPRGIEAEIQQIELSWVAYPGQSGFELFTGVGCAIVDVDHGIAGAVVDLDKSVFSVHAGAGYRFDLGEVLYLRPEVRLRGYDVGDETLDVTASLAIGFDFGD